MAREGELLEIEDEVACGEEKIVRELDLEGGVHRWDDGPAILVYKENADGVHAFLLLAEEDAQCDGTLRMDGRKRAGDDGIEGAEQAEFAIVIDGGIAEGGDLDFHEYTVREAYGICNTGRKRRAGL